MDSATDTLEGFRGRGALTRSLMSPAHVSSGSRGKSTALYSIKSPRAREKESASGVFAFLLLFFFCLSGSFVKAERRAEGWRRDQPAKQESLCSDSCGCGTGRGAAETIWRGILKTPSSSGRGRLLRCSLSKVSQTFLLEGKDLARHVFSVVNHLTRISVHQVNHV